MGTIIELVAIWFALSIPVSLVVGAVLASGGGDSRKRAQAQVVAE